MEKFKKELIEVCESNLDFTKLPKFMTSEIIVANMIDSIGSSARLAHIAQSNPELFKKTVQLEDEMHKGRGNDSV